MINLSSLIILLNLNPDLEELKEIRKEFEYLSDHDDYEIWSLVLKILELAGVIIKQQDVVGIAGKEDIEKIQKQKA